MVGTQGLCMSYSACKVWASALCGLFLCCCGLSWVSFERPLVLPLHLVTRARCVRRDTQMVSTDGGAFAHLFFLLGGEIILDVERLADLLRGFACASSGQRSQCASAL